MTVTIRGKAGIRTKVGHNFNISRNTLYLWLKQEKITGNYQAQKPGQKGNNAKIQDREKEQKESVGSQH
jgi:transposase